MKKLFLFLVLGIFVSSMAFAQLAQGISVNAWGRGVFVPMWYETPEFLFGEVRDGSEGIFRSGTGVSWVPNAAPRVDFRIHGATDFVGFTVHSNSEFLSRVGSGDNGAQLWVQPFGNNWLRLTVANHFQNDTLRGLVSTDTGFENFVLGRSMMGFAEGREPLNQDAIFNRFAGGRGTVAAADESNTSTHITTEAMLANVFFLSSSPIEGLFIGMMLQGMFPATELSDSWRQVQIGAGYRIPDIGFVRLQYIGGFFGTESSSLDMFRLGEPAKIEAAFAFTGIENLVLDLGVKFWLPVELYIGDRAFRGVDVALGGTYRHGDFRIAAMVQALHIGGYTGAQRHTTASDLGRDGMHLVFNAIPSFDFDFGTVGMSFIFQTRLADTNSAGEVVNESAWTRFGLGAWFRRGMAGGSLTTGVAFAAPSIREGPRGGETHSGFHGRGIISVPIILEYAFF